MEKKELTSVQKARLRYEERNKEERKAAHAQFSTFIPRKLQEEINEFLKLHRISKVQLIFEGYEALKKQFENLNKK